MNRRATALVFGLILALGAAATARAQEGSMVAVFKLTGPLAEAPPPTDFGALLGGGKQTNMFELLRALNKARNDDAVKAIVLELDEAALGLAQVQELRAAIKKVRDADKDVWVYGEALGGGRYLLASAASKIVLMPHGDFTLTGLYGDSSYYKNMLDKIGVQADIIHIGDFKSAGEPFYRTGPSKEADEQTNRLLDGMFEQMIEMVAESRQIDPAALRSLIDRGMMSPREAVEAKLVDELMFRQDFNAALKRKYGNDVKLTRKYGQKDEAHEVDLSNPMGMFKLFQEMMGGETSEAEKRPAIAVVYVESMITSGKTQESPFGGGRSSSGSDSVAKALDKAREDESVKAVILRVDSPGGSAVASDVICESLVRCQKEKPVVVSMGNVAGSGGYYVACQAETIFAEPTTITGSIGVVGGKMVTRGLWDWVGITSHEYKRGARSDVFNTNRPFSEEERTMIRDMMLRVYGDFKERVTTGRGKKIKQELEQLAGGRVYTGKHALELGLVDKLGGLADAVRFAKEKAELDKFELKVYPEPKSLGDMLREAFGQEESGEEAEARVGASLTGLTRLLQSPEFQAVQAVDPARAAAIGQFLKMVETLGRERVLMADLAIPVIR